MDRIRRTLARLLTTAAGRLWPDDTPLEARIRGLSAQPSVSTPREPFGRSDASTVDFNHMNGRTGGYHWDGEKWVTDWEVAPWQPEKPVRLMRGR